MNRVILGRRRHGKSTLMMRILAERGRPAIVVSFDKNIRKRFPCDRSFTSARAMLSYIIKNNGVDINRPLLISVTDEAEFTAVCKIVIAHKNLLFLIDEADMFDSAASPHPELMKIVHYGAHDFGGEGDLLVIARRPQDLSRAVRSQADEFYFFRMMDDLELAYIEKNINAALAERVRALRKYEYIFWDTDDLIEHRKLPPPPRGSRGDRRETDLSRSAPGLAGQAAKSARL